MVNVHSYVIKRTWLRRPDQRYVCHDRHDRQYHHTRESELKELTRYLEILRDHPKLSCLTTLVDDGEGGITFRIIQLLRGQKTDAKKALLNITFVAFCMHARKKGHEVDGDDSKSTTASALTKGEAAYLYQPSSVNQMLKCVFKSVKEFGVVYEQNEFKSFPGSYQAYNNALWA